MAHWMCELSAVMAGWLSENPRRTLATLRRRLKSPVSYNTLKYALEGKHATSPATVFMILDVICSPEERASFKRKHFPQYMKAVEPIQVDYDLDSNSATSEELTLEAPTLSGLERHIIFRLAKKGRLSLQALSDFADDDQIKNAIHWMEYYDLGYVDDEFLIARSQKLDVPDFSFLRDITIDTANRINLSRDGDMLEFSSNFASLETARRCWQIQNRASQECRELMDDPNNSGECEVICINMMKFVGPGANT